MKVTKLIFLESLALNIILVGAFMNFAVMKSNEMKMPVLLAESDILYYNPEYSSDPSLTYHKLYNDFKTYSGSSYFLLGDLIHIKNYYISLGDIYIVLGYISLAGILSFYTGMNFTLFIMKKFRLMSKTSIRRLSEWVHS